MKLKIKNKKNSLKIVFKINDYNLYDKNTKIEIKGILEAIRDILEKEKGVAYGNNTNNIQRGE